MSVTQLCVCVYTSVCVCARVYMYGKDKERRREKRNIEEAKESLSAALSSYRSYNNFSVF